MRTTDSVPLISVCVCVSDANRFRSSRPVLRRKHFEDIYIVLYVKPKMAKNTQIICFTIRGLQLQLERK
jgi:hypothetical protein